MTTVLDRVDRSFVQHDPYPHIVIHDCLPADVYATLEAEYPTDDTVLHYSRASEAAKRLGNARHDFSACEILANPGAVSSSWLEFVQAHVSQQFLGKFVELFAPEIRTTYPWLERRIGKNLDSFRAGVRFHPEFDFGEVSLDCQIGINTPSTKTSSVRRVHTDAGEELFAGLLYFRQADDESTGGDLELHEWRSRKRREFFGEAVDDSDSKLFSVVPYRANTLVLFLNSANALHAVSNRSPSMKSRRLVNIVGRMYRTLPEGLFDKPQAPIGRRILHRARNWLR